MLCRVGNRSESSFVFPMLLLFTLRESREGFVRLNLNHEVALDRRADLAFPRMRGPFKRRNDGLQELRIHSSPLDA
jgi:hypothetical protein